MPHAADTGLVLQLLSGETSLVKVHTYQVRHASNNMCQVCNEGLHFVPLPVEDVARTASAGGPCLRKRNRCQKAEFALQTVNRRDMGLYVQKTITVLLVVHVFDCMADTFRPRLGMPKELPLQIHNARKALQLIDAGKQPMTQTARILVFEAS